MLYTYRNSRYFYIMEHLLCLAARDPVSGREGVSVLSRDGFVETVPYLKPKLLEATSSESYGLLESVQGGFKSILNHEPAYIPSALELSWIKAMLQNEKARLFFGPEQWTEMSTAFEEIEPLYAPGDMMLRDVSEERDDFSRPEYEVCFKMLLKAVQEKTVVKITYESKKDSRIVGCFQPLHLEYSPKDDKFRVETLKVDSKRVRRYRFNLDRITQIELADLPWKVLHERKQKSAGLKQVDIEIRNWRNGFERCFIQLSAYNRISEYNEETKTCTTTLYYSGEDEAELLIQLLSFGPIIKVLGPEPIKRAYVERVMAQKTYLEKDLTMAEKS